MWIIFARPTDVSDSRASVSITRESNLISFLNLKFSSSCSSAVTMKLRISSVVGIELSLSGNAVQMNRLCLTFFFVSTYDTGIRISYVKGIIF